MEENRAFCSISNCIPVPELDSIQQPTINNNFSEKIRHHIYLTFATIWLKSNQTQTETHYEAISRPVACVSADRREFTFSISLFLCNETTPHRTNSSASKPNNFPFTPDSSPPASSWASRRTKGGWPIFHLRRVAPTTTTSYVRKANYWFRRSLFALFNIYRTCSPPGLRGPCSATRRGLILVWSASVSRLRGKTNTI